MKKAAKKTRAKRSAKPEKVLISISIPQELVERIDALAELENRNRSNFISNTMLEACEQSS